MSETKHTMVAGADVNAVLHTVTALTKDGNQQLTLIGVAFVIACRSIGVPRETALEVVSGYFDQDIPLVPLAARNN